MADIEHVSIADPNIHEPKDISSAADGFVYIANGSGSGAWADPSTTIPNRVVISSIQDIQEIATNNFVADNFYQMPDFTEVFFTGSSASPLVLDLGLRVGIDTVLNSSSPVLAHILVQITDKGDPILNSAIQCIDRNLFINNLFMTGQGAGFTQRGMWIDLAENQNLVVLDNVVVSSMSVAASVDIGPLGLFSMEGTSTLSNNEGWIFLESAGLGTGPINYSQGVMSGNIVSAIDLSNLSTGLGTTGFTVRSLTVIVPSTGVFIKTTPSGGDISTGALGKILTGNVTLISGGTFFSVGSTENDLRWTVLGTSGISDTITAGRLFSTAGATITLSTGTPVLINPPTDYQNTTLKRFAEQADGIIEYIDEEEIFCLVSAGVSGQPTGGSALYDICIVKNFGIAGEEVLSCFNDLELDFSKDTPITLSGLALIVQGDTFCMTITRQSATNDFVAASLYLNVIRS